MPNLILVMMHYKAIFMLVFLTGFQFSTAQYTATDVRHHIKLEAAYLKFYASTLSENSTEYRMMEDGKQFNVIWDWDFDEMRYLGLGMGYLQVGNATGGSVFGEINFFVSNGILNPYMGARVGYSYLKIPENTTQGAVMASFIAGLQIRLGVYAYPAIILQTSLRYEHKALFIPLTLGYKF